MSRWRARPSPASLSQVRSRWALGGCAFAVGFFFDAPRPAIAALITDLVPPALRGRAFGRLYWAMNLGAAIAEAAGSLLVDGHFACCSSWTPPPTWPSPSSSAPCASRPARP
ncbi:MFS transporter [Streptomyces sp. NPDC059991]|uniref:MFS transporter n=1 Tax=Streptomyces sp. NPDC059991 TaxID=3347028 RepID=UPI0036977C01